MWFFDGEPHYNTNRGWHLVVPLPFVVVVCFFFPQSDEFLMQVLKAHMHTSLAHGALSILIPLSQHDRVSSFDIRVR